LEERVNVLFVLLISNRKARFLISVGLCCYSAVLTMRPQVSLWLQEIRGSLKDALKDFWYLPHVLSVIFRMRISPFYDVRSLQSSETANWSVIIIITSATIGPSAFRAHVMSRLLALDFSSLHYASEHLNNHKDVVSSASWVVLQLPIKTLSMCSSNCGAIQFKK
jgi:hypothetical protein